MTDSRPTAHVESTRQEILLYRVFRAVLLGFAKVWFRLRVENAEKVPATGAFILAPIHRSNLDFLVVLAVTKRRMRYLAKDSLWKPGWGKLFTALGGIPVARGSADREALRIRPWIQVGVGHHRYTRSSVRASRLGNRRGNCVRTELLSAMPSNRPTCSSSAPRE